MTIADFLAQAGFWQWIGMIILAMALASFSPIKITNNYQNKDASK
jgi:hypothetical protein